MVRTFGMMAALLLTAIVATIGFGFWSFFLAASDLKKDVFFVHFTLGLLTVIGGLFVHCLIFIYFLGTGRWVKEVTLAYRMPDEPWHKQTRELKRKVFPPALFAMLIGIAAAAAGEGVRQVGWPWPVHFASAVLTLAINLWAFRIELACVRANAEVLQGVLEEVDRIRLAQGLNTNAEALLEEEAQLVNAKRTG